MKHFIATSAIALLISSPALAQTTGNDQTMTDETTTMATFIDAAHESDVLASEIMGASVFAYGNGAMQDTSADTSTDMRALRMIDADERNNLEEIGSISDVLVDQEGTIRGVIVGVGGFLGIGEREVALGLGELTFARDADDPDNLLILAQVDAQMLEEAPEFDREAFQQRTAMTDEQETAPTGLAERDPPEQEVAEEEMTEQDVAEEDVAEEEMDREETMAETRPAQDAGDQQWRQGREPFATPTFEREGYSRAEAESFSVDQLLSANVYDVNDENIANVNDIMAGGDDNLEYMIIDVGGFLGIGTRTVAIGFDEVTVLHDGADSLRIYVDVTKETLENMPEYQS